MQRKNGILVASDENTESLLPWWWDRYSSYNSLPVAFVDFGMSLKMREWCSEKGEVIPFPENRVYEGHFDNSRNAWFKKPAAHLLSPFEQTLWLDIDCEVLSSIECAFSFLHENTELAICYGSAVETPKGLETAFDAETLCNSGVVVFKRESSMIQEWAKKALYESDKYLGDECILSELISLSKSKVSLLPEVYNWRMCRGFPLYAKIVHWKGEWGKKYILKHGGLKPMLEKFPQLHSLY